jgi:hypothetical protein
MNQLSDTFAFPGTRSPFARLRIGPKSFDIADADPSVDGGALAFRVTGGADWIVLQVGIADGWHRIGADILLNDPAVLPHFLRTHAVRLSGWFAPGDRIDFDTLGTKWSVTCPDDRIALVEFDGRPVGEVAQSQATSADPREKAIDLLIAVVPDLRGRFGAMMDEWAGRLAAGASVTPII